jgi:hypothetical protein
MAEELTYFWNEDGEGWRYGDPDSRLVTAFSRPHSSFEEAYESFASRRQEEIDAYVTDPTNVD